jgi:bacterioferritin-associated ferredoxin
MSERERGVIVCRCEEVTREEIDDAIRSGASSMWQVRRLTRAGMGLCQGRSCEHLVARQLAEGLELPMEVVLRPSYRPPLEPIPIDTLCSGQRIIPGQDEEDTSPWLKSLLAQGASDEDS